MSHVLLNPSSKPVENSQQQLQTPMVEGQVLSCLPADLYIPPDALKVVLETFEGPLDLLLYLIKRQNLNILDIPIAEITRQYQCYIELMQELKLVLAVEYLIMAALLAEIKSNHLLPPPVSCDIADTSEDSQTALIQRLQEYERFKQAAIAIDALPRTQRDIVTVQITTETVLMPAPPLSITKAALAQAFEAVLSRAIHCKRHQISKETLSVKGRMTQILQHLNTIRKNQAYIAFSQLLNHCEGRLGVVVTLMAILELSKQSVIEIAQEKAYAPIHIKIYPLKT